MLFAAVKLAAAGGYESKRARRRAAAEPLDEGLALTAGKQDGKAVRAALRDLHAVVVG